MIARQEIIQGSCLDALPTLSEKSVHTIVTSPPYWGLRSYGFAKDDPARRKMIGMEPTFDRHLWNLVRVFREVRRVLRDDGTLWLNYGDAYATAGGAGLQGKNGQRANRTFTAEHCPARGGFPEKNLIGMAWRLAFALQADGWYLRSDIIWHKRSPMPESVRDRPTKAHEYVFLLSKSPRYFYDAEASRERCLPQSTKRMPAGYVPLPGDDVNHFGDGFQRGPGYELTSRNMRSVWTLSTEPTRDLHFATFPTELVARCLKPGTSDKGCCAKCGAPWRRVTKKQRRATRPGQGSKVSVDRETGETIQRTYKPWAAAEVGKRDPKRHVTDFTTVGWRPDCDCDGEPVPCRVLDPFAGSGTVGIVCRRMGLNFIGIELNPKYCGMARGRISRAMDDEPLVPQVEGQLEMLL